jgi:hypothetical protein
MSTRPDRGPAARPLTRAARSTGSPRPSEALVTSTVQGLAMGQGIAFAGRGSHTLTGVPEHLFAVQHLMPPSGARRAARSGWERKARSGHAY